MHPKKVLDPNAGNQFLGDADKPKYFLNLPSGFNQRIGRVDAFYHYLTKNDGNENNTNMKKPSDSKLFGFLDGFFEFAGGIFVSSGTGVKDTKELDISNSRGLSILGSFHKDSLISDHDELDSISKWLKTYTLLGNATVGKLAEVVNQLGEDVGDHHIIGIQPWARIKARVADVESAERQFIKLDQTTEFKHEGGPDFAIGHKASYQRDGLTIFDFLRINIIKPSAEAYKLAVEDFDDQLQITYRNAKEDPQEKNQKAEEDRQLVGEAPDQEKLNELLQRYDLKSFVIDAPKTEEFTPLSVQSASGSVVEMTALRNVSLKEYNSVNIKPLKSSSKTIYGLEVPNEFKVTTNSFSIKVASDGITTTIGESTLKLLPPDRQFVISLEMEAFGTPSINPRLKAAQRNFLGL